VEGGREVGREDKGRSEEVYGREGGREGRVCTREWEGQKKQSKESYSIC
jgi:hypothetical protein